MVVCSARPNVFVSVGEGWGRGAFHTCVHPSISIKERQREKGVGARMTVGLCTSYP